MKKKNEVKLLPGPKYDTRELAKILGDMDTAIFYLAWLRNGLNATQAYLELHPDVEYKSATVLGSRALAKVSIEAIIQAYELGHEAYFTQLKEGLQANRKRAEITDRDDKGRPVYEYFDEPDHKTRRLYHEALGRMLKIEKDKPDTIVPIQINLGEAIAKDRKERGLEI